MTEETKEQPKGLFDKFMDLYAPLAQQDASLSPEDYAQDYREKQNYVLKQLGLISPTSGVTTPENTRPVEDILLRNGSQDQPTMDTVEQYVNNRVNYNPELGPVPVKDPNDPDEYRRNQLLEMMEINQMFDGLLQASDLPPISVDQRSAYTSHLLSKPYDAREKLSKKLVSGDLKALEGLDDINAFYASFPHLQLEDLEVPGSIAPIFIQTIDKVEAGTGGYNSLYANADSTKFSDVKVSEMTLDELAAFSRTSNDYGKWVKPRLPKNSYARKKGYTSTPMGRYQIVGTTLRATIEQMGLDGSEVFTPELQDRMAMHIGKKALGNKTGKAAISALRSTWEGFKKASDEDLLKIAEELRNSSDSQGRPFIGPEAGAEAGPEVIQGDMLSGLVSSVRSALGLGSDEEAQSVAEKLMQSGVIPLPPRRPEGLSIDEPMRLPPRRPTEQEIAEANQLTPSEQRVADAQVRLEARNAFNVDLNKDIEYTTESVFNKLVPSNARAMVADVIFNQLGIDQTKIMRNEDFLSKEVQATAKAYIIKEIADSNKKKGAIEYTDYPSGNKGVEYSGNIKLSHFTDPEMILKTTLGAFTWYTNEDDQIIIEDRFNFNDSEKFKKANPTLKDKIKHLKSYHDNPKTGTYGLVRRAAALFGSSEGEGAGFTINLGKLD